MRAGVERRRVQAKFIARGLRSRDEARLTGEYIDADVVLKGLQRKLQQARGVRQAGVATLKTSPLEDHHH